MNPIEYPIYYPGSHDQPCVTKIQIVIRKNEPISTPKAFVLIHQCGEGTAPDLLSSANFIINAILRNILYGIRLDSVRFFYKPNSALGGFPTILAWPLAVRERSMFCSICRQVANRLGITSNFTYDIYLENVYGIPVSDDEYELLLEAFG